MTLGNSSLPFFAERKGSRGSAELHAGSRSVDNLSVTLTFCCTIPRKGLLPEANQVPTFRSGVGGETKALQSGEASKLEGNPKDTGLELPRASRF